MDDETFTVCQHDSLKKSLAFTGEAPFSIHLVHQHELTPDWTPVSTNSVNEKLFEWSVDTALPGNHTYRVLVPLSPAERGLHFVTTLEGI